MHRIISAIEAASRAGVAVAAVLVAAIFALMLAEIVARGAFSTSTLLSWEWSSYLMAAVMFLAAAGTARSGGLESSCSAARSLAIRASTSMR